MKSKFFFYSQIKFVLFFRIEEIKMIEDHVNELIEGQNKIAASLGER